MVPKPCRPALLFWKWRHWKSIGSYPYVKVLCHLHLELKFKANLKLESGNQKMQYGHQAAILKVTSLKIKGLLPMTTISMHMKFEIEIPKQTWLTLRKPCHLQRPETEKSNMAARRPFWQWCRWKSIGLWLWPPSKCLWNLKFKFQSKLDLCSGNNVVYRRTDVRTDNVNPVYPPPISLGGGIKMKWGPKHRENNISFGASKFTCPNTEIHYDIFCD